MCDRCPHASQGQFLSGTIWQWCLNASSDIKTMLSLHDASEEFMVSSHVGWECRLLSASMPLASCIPPFQPHTITISRFSWSLCIGAWLYPLSLWRSLCISAGQDAFQFSNEGRTTTNANTRSHLHASTFVCPRSVLTWSRHGCTILATLDIPLKIQSFHSQILSFSQW